MVNAASQSSQYQAVSRGHRSRLVGSQPRAANGGLPALTFRGRMYRSGRMQPVALISGCTSALGPTAVSRESRLWRQLLTSLPVVLKADVSQATTSAPGIIDTFEVSVVWGTVAIVVRGDVLAVADHAAVLRLEPNNVMPRSISRCRSTRNRMCEKLCNFPRRLSEADPSTGYCVALIRKIGRLLRHAGGD